MRALSTNQSDLRSYEISSKEERLSVAEGELIDFIRQASDLVGPGLEGYLTEIWLDELACMGSMPPPASPDWRRVSFAALRTLRAQLEMPELFLASFERAE